MKSEKVKSQMKYKLILALLGIFLLFPVQAIEVTVKKAMIKSPVVGQKIAAGFMIMESKNNFIIKKIYADQIDKIEIHTMRMKNGIMRMRKITNPRVGPKSPLILKSGGDHLMFFGINKSLKPGDNIELFFEIESGDKENFTKKINFNIY